MSKFFSNGTEGRAWEAMWCNRCENDHSMHQENGEGGCEYMLYAITDMEEELEGVWFDEHDRFGSTFPPAVRCAKFKSCGACGEDVTLDENGYPSTVRQQEWARPMGSDGPGVLVTDCVLSPPGAVTQKGNTDAH